METVLINEAGNWKSPWTIELKNEMEKGYENVIVGEELLLETDQFKVWNIHLEAGGKMPFHKHNKPYFFAAQNRGKSRSFYVDGKVTETQYEKNDIKYFENLNDNEFFIHNLENVGDTTLTFTTVEFK